MSGNTFGVLFRLTSYGESHESFIGGILEGCPSGVKIDQAFIQSELKRRSPKTFFETPRQEADNLTFLSGIDEGETNGQPIEFRIENKLYKTSDYQLLRNIFRPSHADYTWYAKYGKMPSTGGGRASGRETAVRVVAGAIAKLFLKQFNIDFLAFVSQIGDVILESALENISLTEIENSPVRCPDRDTSDRMIAYLEKIKEEKNSCGGIVNGIIKNVPVGLGEPVYDKLSARLAQAMMSIPSAKGFDLGSGFSAASMKGSEHNDLFVSSEGKIVTSSNHSGGIQGGISNGQDIVFRVAFKPVSSIGIPQKTVDIQGNEVEISIQGRHDVCIVPRVVPVVEAMAALVIADFFLLNQNKL